MHYQCEIVLPPETEDIESAIQSVMRQFDENMDIDNEEFSTKNVFWDFYVIGGRFAGSKQMARYDEAKLEEFNQWCQNEKITCAGFVCGKHELSPASQIPKVDAKWNEMFPQEGNVMVACPIFKHSNDQYGRDGDSTIEGDISKLGESKSVKCSRVIFAGKSYDHETKERTGPHEAVFMLTDSQWNGVNHMDVKWDGTVLDALNQWNAKLENYAEDYRKQLQPTDDWLCVTVDYHS
jgi:hypothetical protein